MKTQISKLSYEPGKRYSGVYQQQGRMITDADWNELVELLKQRLNDALKDVVSDGAPRDRGVAIEAIDSTIGIKSGYLYVDGIEAEVPGGGEIIFFDEQDDFPAAPVPDADAVVYADVWEKTVVSLEDTAMRDPGLHGADTCSRTQTLVQIKSCAPGIEPETDLDVNPGIGNAIADMRLWEESDADSERADPCITEVAENPRIGNYLFRVEVHDISLSIDGDTTTATLTIKWSEENGAEHHGLVWIDNNGDEQYGYEVVPTEFGAEDWVYEFYNDKSERHLGQQLNDNFTPIRGTIRDVFDRNAVLPSVGGELAQYVRRWDGYCVINLTSTTIDPIWVPVTETLSGEDKDQPLQDAETPGHGNVRFSQDEAGNYRMTLYLEKLILTFHLDASDFLAGDYWLAVVREDAPYYSDADPVIDERVTTLNNGNPLGIRHHYIKLADIVAGSIQPYADGSLQQRRMSFPPLTDLSADHISYDPDATVDRWTDVNEASDPPNTVQGAIDDLVGNLESSDIKYTLPDCEVTEYDSPTLKQLIFDDILNKFDEDSLTKVKVEDLWNAVLCFLDAQKIPYNPLLQVERWVDIVDQVELSPNWVKGFGGMNKDYSRDIAMDHEGNVHVTGSFQGTINFGGDDLTAVGIADMFIARFNSDGEHQWSYRFGTSGTTQGEIIAVNEAGEVLVMASFNDAVDLGGCGTFNSSAGYDILLIKFDSDGICQTAIQYSGTANEISYGAALDESGNVVVAGIFEGTLNFGAAGDELTSVGGLDIFIARFNADGSHDWSERYGGNGYDIAYGLALDSQSNIVLTGKFEETINFGAAGDELTSAGKSDIFVAKFDTAGTHLWSHRMGGEITDYGRAVAVAPNDDVVLSGAFQQTLDFDHTSHILISEEGQDIYLVRLDADGNHLWSRSFAGPGNQQALGLSVDNYGRILMVGQFTERVRFDDTELVSQSGNDSFIAALSPSGEPLAVEQLAGDAEDFGHDVVAGPNGMFALSGFYTGNLTFMGTSPPHSGESDLFIAHVGASTTLPQTVQQAFDELVSNLENMTTLWDEKVSKSGDIMTGPLHMAAPNGKIGIGKVPLEALDVVGNCNVEGDVTIQGDLTIKGDTISKPEIVVEDNIITLNKTDAALPSDFTSGIEVYRGASQVKATLQWNESINRWQVGTEDELYNISYGAEIDNLINGSLADGMHEHSRLVRPGTTPPEVFFSINATGNTQLGNGSYEGALTLEWYRMVIRGDNGENISITFDDQDTGNTYQIRGHEGISFHANNSQVAIFTNEGNFAIGPVYPRADLCVGDELGAAISGGTSGGAVFGSNLATNNGNDLYTPISHTANYGYAGIHASWGSLDFYASSGNTSQGQVINPEQRMKIFDDGVLINDLIVTDSLNVIAMSNVNVSQMSVRELEVTNQLTAGQADIANLTSGIVNITNGLVIENKIRLDDTSSPELRLNESSHDQNWTALDGLDFQRLGFPGGMVEILYSINYQYLTDDFVFIQFRTLVDGIEVYRMVDPSIKENFNVVQNLKTLVYIEPGEHDIQTEVRVVSRGTFAVIIRSGAEMFIYTL